MLIKQDKLPNVGCQSLLLQEGAELVVDLEATHTALGEVQALSKEHKARAAIPKPWDGDEYFMDHELAEARGLIEELRRGVNVRTCVLNYPTQEALQKHVAETRSKLEEIKVKFDGCFQVVRQAWRKVEARRGRANRAAF
jgi:hypothetical protein